MWKADIKHIKSHLQKFNSLCEAANFANSDCLLVDFYAEASLSFKQQQLLRYRQELST